MKRMLLALLLCLCVALLAACGSKEPERFNVVTGDAPQVTQFVGTNIPTPEPGDIDFDDGSYDPSSEEGLGEDDFGLSFMDVTPATQAPTTAPTVYSQYAGATPVLIDPIDKPSPTTVPALTFTYQTYDATNLGLSFEGPMGWVVEVPSSDTYVIYNPDPSVDYAATLTLRATPVVTDYGTSELKSEVNSMLSTIGASGFAKWSPSNTASRTLIGHDGIYADYTGTLDTGVQVAGRVQAVCVNRTLYTVHITYPQAYLETYKKGVYNKLRDTIVLSQ